MRNSTAVAAKQKTGMGGKDKTEVRMEQKKNVGRCVIQKEGNKREKKENQFISSCVEIECDIEAGLTR